MNTHPSLPEAGAPSKAESHAGASGDRSKPDANGGAFSWLRSCIIRAFFEYARAQHPVHPDLLHSVEDDGNDQRSTYDGA